MRLACGSTERKFMGLVIIILLLVNTFLAAFLVESVSAAPPNKLTLKWSTSVGSNGRTQGGPLVADINGDGKMEVVVTGAVVTSTGWTTNGSISCLDGATGKILWKDDGNNITNIGVDPRTPFDSADLFGNGKLEIVVYSYSGPLVLFPNGTVYWRRMDVTADANYGAIADVNGDGHPEIFTCGGETPFMTSGTDYIAELTYDGKLLHETPSWHPCFGGLSIADISGHWILFEGDRSASYSGQDDLQKGGGWGIRALDAQTLTPLWNDSSILCSSQCPVLADVTGQGQLEVVIAMQTNKGFAVLNATNGSVITDWNGTGGYIYRKGAAGQGLSSHSQLTVGDFDGDGHLEAVVDGQGTPAKIWDLYDWKLDAVLPITCWEPPGAGYVTADGKLDLIAVNASGKDIHIYSFDKTSQTYIETDNITTGIDGANAFTVVQDVDGDGYNELVVSGYTGWVYCYDTPAKAANPLPRSGLQFYSEYKRRIAEYVPPAGPLVLTVNVVGNGHVDRNDTGPYTYGSAVQLTAVNDSGWVFQSWSGDLTGNANPATVEMTGDKTVTAIFTFTQGPVWWDINWQYRRSIIIDHQKVTADQTNFPVVLDLTDSSLSSKAQANGNDFVFVDANNNKLSHEIEMYDNNTGHLVAWVNVPTLSSSVDTVFYMYYGNPTCPSQQNKSAVWNTNYLAVLHLDEKTGTQYDSTSNQNNGTPTSPLTQGAAGKIDGADNFTGGYVQLPRVCTSQTQFTFSTWIYPTSGARYIISEWSTNNQGAFLQISSNNVVQFYVNGVFVQMPVSLNQWHYVVGTFNGTYIQLWVDGGSSVSVSGSAPIWPSQSLYVGDRSDHLRKFNGLIDEVRVSNVALSSSWVNTEYNNQNAPSTFYTIGTEETVH